MRAVTTNEDGAAPIGESLGEEARGDGAAGLLRAARLREAGITEIVTRALDRKQGMLAFQPVMSAADPTRAAFHEALIRITDDAGRIVPAGEFIAAVEDGETGRRIDCLALELGLRELACEPSLRLAINMSARSIGYRPWARVLEAGLAARPDVGERLILEITERSAMGMPELVLAFMEEAHEHGVAFSLDDFGAGQTSLRYLRDFAFDILKIDGQFVRNIAESPDDRAITAAMLDIARHFEMLTVAEGVETAEDAETMTRMGADCLQGWHCGMPTVRPAWREAERRLA